MQIDFLDLGVCFYNIIKTQALMIIHFTSMVLFGWIGGCGCGVGVVWCLLWSVCVGVFWVCVFFGIYLCLFSCWPLCIFFLLAVVFF